MLLRLKWYLLKNRISQTMLAHQLGIHEPTLSKIINGWKPVPDGIKEEICKILNASEEDLFPEDDEVMSKAQQP